MLTMTMRRRPCSSEVLANTVRPELQFTIPCSVCFTVSTHALGENGFLVFLRGGKKPADPNNLLKTFIFADFEDHLLRVTKLVGREPVSLPQTQNG